MPLIEELPSDCPAEIENKENIKVEALPSTAAAPNRIKIDSWDDVYAQCGVAAKQNEPEKPVVEQSPAPVSKSSVWSGPK